MKKLLTSSFVILLFISIIFSWKFWIRGDLPIPADTIVGLYHPYRDLYSKDYPNGIPFKNFLITDPVRQQYPWRLIAIDDLVYGVIPSWNPYSFAGTPLASNIQSAPFYPLNIIFFILPFSLAWSILVFCQTFMAGLFMYMFLSKLCTTKLSRYVGAISFSFSSIFISWYTWNSILHVLVWLPLMLYSLEQILRVTDSNKTNLTKYAFILTFSSLCIILAGHVQASFYCFIIFAVYAIVRLFTSLKDPNRSIYRLRRLFLIVISSLGFSFIVSFPIIYEFFHYVSYSYREVDGGTWQQDGWFIPLYHFVQFISPDFFGNPATLNYWGVWNYGELTGYIGIVGIIFAFYAIVFAKGIYRNIFLGLLIGGIAFSTKNILSILPFTNSIPFISTSQPTRLLIVIVFSLSVLSSLGVDEFILKEKQRMKILYIISGMLVLLGMMWIFAIYRMSIIPHLTENSLIAQRNLYLPTFLVLAITIWIVCILFLFKNNVLRKFSGIFFLPFLAILVFDLFRFGWKFTPFTPKTYLYPETKTVHFLKTQPNLFRIMTIDNRILPPNFNIVHKIQSIDGYDPLYLKNYAELSAAIVRKKPDISPFSFNRIITLQDPDNKIIDFMNVKYILSLTDIQYPHLVKVFEEGLTKVYENKRVYPRAFFVNSIVKASSKQEAINLLFDPHVNLRETAVVFDDMNIDTSKLTQNEQVFINKYKNSIVEMETKTDKIRLLVFSDVFYPKWKAYIDGYKAKLYEVNYAFRGVVVPPGDHTVRFMYEIL